MEGLEQEDYNCLHFTRGIVKSVGKLALTIFVLLYVFIFSPYYFLLLFYPLHIVAYPP